MLLAPAARGYIRLSISYSDGTVAVVKRIDVTGAGLPFYINNLIVPGVQSSASGKTVTVISPGSNPVYAIKAAAASWNGVSTSAIKFLPLQSTTKLSDPNDGQNTILIGSTASDLSIVGGAVAVTYTISSSAHPGDISDSDIILNPATAFSTDGSTVTDLQAVMTHEFGHSLGLNHSGLLGATMFQYAELSERWLSEDEIAFADAVYPAQPGTLGTLSGKVAASGGSPVQAGLVAFIDTTHGYGLSALTASDGTYSLQAPAGSYIVSVEPMTSKSVVQPANLYLSAFTPVTSNFQTTVLGGLTSPTVLTVTAGATTNVPDVTVTPGSSSLTPPFVGAGKAGGSGDILTVVDTAVMAPSGQSVDIGLTGGGIDQTVSIQAIGQGVSVHPGSVRADPRVTFGGQPLVRVTLDIAARQNLGLASLIISKGTSVLANSGLVVIVPPTPTFTPNAVVSAASYKGPTANGGVSPGGIYSIYDTVNNSLGPNPYVQPAGYDGYGNLATSLGGVTVTFDGVAAPLFLSYSGQLNVQVPFEVAGKTSTQVVVNFYGSASAPVPVPVVAAQPAFFTVTPGGTDPIVQNFPDYSLNKAGNPIARGGIVLLYGTGLGNLGYPLSTGQPGVVPPSSYSSRYSCSFGGVPASAFAYWNYGFVGEATWTVTVPSNAPTGAVTLTCTDSASGASTQQGTIYIK
jgi:uncharacterized protein (TIGR03437 family)